MLSLPIPITINVYVTDLLIKNKIVYIKKDTVDNACVYTLFRLNEFFMKKRYRYVLIKRIFEMLYPRKRVPFKENLNKN